MSATMLSGLRSPAPVRRCPQRNGHGLPWPETAAVLLALALAMHDAVSAPGEEESLAQGVVAAINGLRTDPGSWAEWLSGRRELYRGEVLKRPDAPPVKTREGVAALEEAASVLRGIAPRPPLATDPTLAAVAREHVASAGPAGLTGHAAANGLTLTERLVRHGVERVEVAEAVTYGPARAREVVAVLVIDDGVEGRAHRDMILDPAYVDIGVACGPHARHGSMCVVLLSTGELPEGAGSAEVVPRQDHSPGERPAPPCSASSLRSSVFSTLP